MADFLFNRAKKELLGGSSSGPSMTPPALKVVLLEGQRTGTTSVGNTDITAMANSAGLVGMDVIHSSFAAGTRVASILSGTSVRCTSNATASSVGVQILFQPNRDMDFLSEISGIELTATNYSRGTLTGVTTGESDATDEGFLDANDITFSTLGGTDIVTGLVIFSDTAVDSTSLAIAHVDSNFPVTLAAIDFIVQWHANGIIRG